MCRVGSRRRALLADRLQDQGSGNEIRARDLAPAGHFYGAYLAGLEYRRIGVLIDGDHRDIGVLALRHDTHVSPIDRDGLAAGMVRVLSGVRCAAGEYASREQAEDSHDVSIAALPHLVPQSMALRRSLVNASFSHEPRKVGGSPSGAGLPS